MKNKRRVSDKLSYSFPRHGNRKSHDGKYASTLPDEGDGLEDKACKHLLPTQRSTNEEQSFNIPRPPRPPQIFEGLEWKKYMEFHK